MGAATERRRRTRTAVAAAIAIAASLSACDSALVPPFSGESAPPTAPPSSAPAAPGSEGAPPVVADRGPRVVPGPVALGGDRVAGLVPRLAAMRTDGFVVSARWTVPPGTTAFGEALTARVAAAVRGFADANGAGWTPGVDLVAGGASTPCSGGSAFAVTPTRLSIDCSIVVASGTVIGERLVIAEIGPDGAAQPAREVWYADGADGGVHDGAGLYAAGSEKRVLALVAEALRAAGRVDTGEDPFAGTAPEAARALLVDSAAGGAGVVVTLAVPGTERSRPTSVHMPWRLLEPFLSEPGATVRSAAVSGDPYEPPSAPGGDDPVDCTLLPCASLTFDDGPTSLTPSLLDVLDRERAAATFYVQGSSVARNPGTAARIVAAGHEIANHTWAHPNLTKLTDEQVRDEVRRTQDAIAAATGVRATSLRPPYGASNAKVRELVALPFVVWDIDTRDWQDPGVDVVVDRAAGGAAPGSIVLLHDTHQDTIDAVPSIIDRLRSRGFALVSVADQFGGALPGRGVLVSHGPR
ncbi:polysaccharide deacetylase family protein [Agromyces kandeliae]|uniref:Polysaccharide deacetylase family protein n=1 Tax=Agromyces kandeliae TaxID=2666141 RepID=A0A6L5R0U5_9MICO|nr:polysaccharide deacetylase family protein [Agromyces kandeliae]MRX43589.1 polysaccharide deacetylase family protein [Agromyces kandeliae]